jgi:putative redox protein
MKDAINVTWKGDMAFEAILNNHRIVVDARQEVGGNDQGPQPKPLIMVSLAGCTAMDVISILKKMKVQVGEFHVRVEATLTDEHPKHFTAMHLIYVFKGDDLPQDKLQRAIDLSLEKYCGVSATLKKALNLTYEILVN